jgi:hypothetical protein
MNIQAEKEYIKRELDKVDDIHLVEAIKNILEFGKAKKYEQTLYPMSKETFYMRNELSRKIIKDNSLISQEDAKSYFSGKYDKKKDQH